MAASNPQNTKEDDINKMFKISDPSSGIYTYNAVIRAPYMITSMGRLLVISAEQDFSLTDDSDNVKFQYIKYPDSFRACVVQVSQGIRQAFNTAHHNMDCIRMKSENIVENVEKGIEVLQESKNNKKINQNEWPIVERYLRDTEKECEECIETAASITEEFGKIAMTMDELVEALIRSEGKNKNELKATNLEMEKTREKRETETKRKNELGKDCEETSNKIEDAKKNYEEAVNSFPSPWKIKVMRSIDSLADFARRLKEKILSRDQEIPEASVSTNETVEPSTSPENEITNEEANAYLDANDILNHAKMLMSTSCDKEDITKVKTSLEEMCSDLNLDAPQSDVRTVKELCENGIEICNEIHKEIDQAKNRSAATNARVEKFFERAKDFYNKAKHVLQNIERPKPADDKIYQKPGGRFTERILQTPKRNERKAKEVLLKGYESYQCSYDKMVQATKEIEKILDDMVKFDERTLELEKIRKTLDRSQDALNLVVEYWGDFHSMFKKLHNFIKERQFKKLATLKDLPSLAKTQDKTSQNRMHQMVLEESKEALEHAYIVEETSSFYCCVSEKYLLNGVTSLQRLISLDPSKDGDATDKIRQKLQNGQERAKNEILAIAQESGEDLREKIKRL